MGVYASHRVTDNRQGLVPVERIKVQALARPDGGACSVGGKMVAILGLAGIWPRSLKEASVREKTVRKSHLCYILCNLDKFSIAPAVNFATG